MKVPYALLLAATLSACAAVPTRGQEVAGVFDRVQSSVVTIRTAQKSPVPDRTGQFASIGGIGSGVLISEDGQILTASHVVQTADALIVEFSDGTTRLANVLSSDTVADVALVKMDGPVPKGLHVAELGDSDAVKVGDRVMVVGAPRGIGHTLTVGYVSARRYRESAVNHMVEIEQFQTDAAINQGNSGGPMFDSQGRVVGIVSYIVSQSGGSEGLGFAVTSKVIQKILLEGHHFWSGINGLLLEGELAAAFNLPEGQSGLLIQQVAANSPADRMGMKGGTVPISIQGFDILIGGDIILEVFGIPIGTAESYAKINQKLKSLEGEAELEVVLLRAGKRYEVSGKLSSPG